MTINMLHFTCEFVGNKGEAFVGLMGRSISGEGEHKALKIKNQVSCTYPTVGFLELQRRLRKDVD